MSEKIDLLDHGFIRLVDCMGNDESVVRAARVSYDAAWRAGENEGSDARLIHYLWKHEHATPFESVVFTFDMKMPIFVARQLMRYRTAVFNELSGRYRELPEECYLPAANQIRAQSKTNKQGSDGLVDDTGSRRAVNILDGQNKNAFAAYRTLLGFGVARELARTVLPLSTYTHLFMTVNLRNLFHILKQRLDSHAQMEIRVYAEAMLELIRPVVPVCVAAWEEGRKS